MSDLVKRLRQMDRGWPTILSTAADRIEFLEASEHGLWGRIETCRQDEAALRSRIEQLERELAEAQEQRDGFSAMYAAEKALADRLYKSPYDRDEEGSRAAYRKARGL